MSSLTCFISVKESESESHSAVCNSLPPHRLYSPWTSPGQDTGVGSCSLLLGIFPTQGSNPGLPHCRWILYQLSHKGSSRILQWVACPFSSGPSRSRNRGEEAISMVQYFILPFCVFKTLHLLQYKGMMPENV